MKVRLIVIRMLSALLFWGTVIPTTSLEEHFDSNRELWYAFYAGDTFCEDPERGMVYTNYNENKEVSYLLTPELESWKFHFQCDKDHYSQFRKIHDQSSWNLLHSRYNEVTHQNLKSSLDGERINGFKVPFEIKFIEGKGRGVVAKSYIRKGEHVYSSQVNSAQFWNLESFFDYIKSLPKVLACDVLDWAYVTDFGNHVWGTECIPVLTYEMDEGALFNTKTVDSRQNVGCHPMFDGIFPNICINNFFALENIYPGEELILNYLDFLAGNSIHFSSPIIVPLIINSTAINTTSAQTSSSDNDM